MASSLAADEVTDALDRATAAYRAQDLNTALSAIDMARQQVISQQQAELVGFLPAAPDGWARVETLPSSGTAATVSAEYIREDGLAHYTVYIHAGAEPAYKAQRQLRNARALGRPIFPIHGVRFVEQNGDLMGLVGANVVVEADGATPEILHAALSSIDFRSLLTFGSTP